MYHPRQAASDPSGKLAHPAVEAPRQGCSVFSPVVEEGRKPRRRPRDRSAGRNPLDPARVSHYQAYLGSATPCRGRIYYDDLPFPGVFGTSCLDTRAKGRRSLRGSAPAGTAGGVAPLAGARSIGIGHPRSGDRCTTHHPAPLDPARASPTIHLLYRRPARGKQQKFQAHLKF